MFTGDYSDIRSHLIWFILAGQHSDQRRITLLNQVISWQNNLDIKYYPARHKLLTAIVEYLSKDEY